MLEGRDRLLPSLASPAFLPQFPPACSGGDSVDPGSHLGAPADDACEVPRRVPGAWLVSSALLLPISHREGEKCLQSLEGKAVQA